MRIQNISDDLKVNAIAGTYVVTLGFNLPEEKCEGLKGFSVQRTDHETGVTKYIEGMKAFEETNPGYPAGARYPTNEQPIQSFQWADYAAKPGKSYTYKVAALKGTPSALEVFAETSFEITTESPENGTHDIYFNRGVAASQEYTRRFGDKKPDEVPNNAAFDWLSRGLYEAMTEFVSSCDPDKHALRIGAYEFHYEPFLEVIKEASDKGVDIEIVYDARKASPKDKNRKAVENIGLGDLCNERTMPKSYISHNKFIVKLENGEPVSVWTGGTNFSQGGIFGHSNVAHVIEEREAAEKYLAYWELLKQDLRSKEMRQKVEELSPLPDVDNLPVGTTIIFSPRKGLEALDFYADLALRAKSGLFMTFAFGMNDKFKNVYETSQAPLRFALLEKPTRPMDTESQEYADEVQRIRDLRKKPENIFAIGDLVRTNELENWVEESLSGMNGNIRYVHNKFMLIDPLSNDPVIVGGSANFSDTSTTNNDENMAVIRGDTRVADIYIGEFMRLYSHHAFRESLNRYGANKPLNHLRTDDWWRKSFGETPESKRRQEFAQVPK